jgi:YD repeat-containing protein
MSNDKADNANTRTPEAHLDEEIHPQIVSMVNHGDDHAIILIRTADGEELELRFDYDGEGQLIAHHGEHEYVIPVEVEMMSDETDEYESEYEEDDEEHEDDDDQMEHHGAMPTFENFINECWTPMNEGYNPALSDEAKRAIKTICEEILIKEAQMCDEDHDEMHTYENYLNECGQYMTECMMEAATNIQVK